MAEQDFSILAPSPGAADTGLLRQVERIVIEAHRRAEEAAGRTWSEPIAYHWLRYEDPNPVGRLQEGARKLRRRGVKFDADAVDKACLTARKRGFSN